MKMFKAMTKENDGFRIVLLAEDKDDARLEAWTIYSKEYFGAYDEYSEFNDNLIIEELNGWFDLDRDAEVNREE